ncbi:MAG: hypothetical protein N5P05_000355 [Chroococcopsis gigantea SAG 12.99]|jgi:hypothetical protein|nr:hypothetical protein [Chroococcopsis gigantea SAG 12.99]
MNTFSNSYRKSISPIALVMGILAFWLSATVVIDLVVIPSLSATGMMVSDGFASAGFLLFGIFNRIELLCAASVVCCFLILGRHHTLIHLPEHRSLIFAGLLLVITVIYTYFLSPNMSSLGMIDPLNSATEMSKGMIGFHQVYWVLEVVKVILIGKLLKWCYRDSCNIG